MVDVVLIKVTHDSSLENRLTIKDVYELLINKIVSDANFLVSGG